MKQLYDFLIFMFSIALRPVSIFNAKAKQRQKGLLRQKSEIKNIQQTDSRRIWMHCASLGEFEQGRPLLERIKQQNPEVSIILTFFSPSGYEKRKNFELADKVFYLPADTLTNARRFVQSIRPDVVFFVKYEFWYRHLAEAQKAGAKLILIAGIFRQNQIFFKPWGGFFRKILRLFSHFYLQNTHSQKLLESIGINNSTVCGDPRFDRVQEIAAQEKSIKGIRAFKNNKLLLVAGSTWSPDEKLLTQFIKQADNNLKLMIAPHEIVNKRMAQIEKQFPQQVIRYSEIHEANPKDKRILIIDNIGMLSYLYRYADICMTGGGFGVGIHNTLEAAVYAKPIIFGPNYKKFSEAKALVESGAGFPVSNQEELNEILNKLTENADFRRQAGDSAKAYCGSMTGSTKLIYEEVFNPSVDSQKMQI
ncbi:MAG: glycosyltransferase N-terminal domain-containing protein [Bacteroidota bacterium]|nr:glycosyltransferase N-terminal domain-containing protein [Bacteroidota bacterium]